jgi:hypothetical protein
VSGAEVASGAIGGRSEADFSSVSASGSLLSASVSFSFSISLLDLLFGVFSSEFCPEFCGERWEHSSVVTCGHANSNH